MSNLNDSNDEVNNGNVVPPPPPAVPKQLSAALAHLKKFNQFVIWNAVADSAAPKPRKVPADYRTGQPANAHDPAVWTDHETAAKSAVHFGASYDAGFTLTRETHLALLDYDDALQADGTWHPTFHKIASRLPGTALEVSHSGKGLHQWITYRGELPANDITTVIIDGLKVELFLAKKFIALGEQTTAVGDASTDCTAALTQLIEEFFQPTADTKDAEWRDGHELGYELPDDDELIERALRMTAGPAVFKDGVTFKDLWEANSAVLAKRYPDPSGERAYDANRADLALAGKLAWITGNDCPRIDSLMRRSALARDKWEKHKTYLTVYTIPKALVRDGDFYNPNHYIDEAKRRREQIEEATRIGEGSEEHTTAEVLTLDQMLERFIYIGDGDRVQDLKHPREVVPFDQFVKFHRSSKTEVVIEGKVDKDGKPKTKMVETTRQWEHGDRKQVKTVTFRPGAKTRTEDPNGNPASNTWTPFDRSKPGGDPSIFLNHVEYLFGADTPRFLDWLAHIEQTPGEVPHTGWVHISLAQGKGRNWLANVLCRVWKGHVANSFNLSRMLRTGFDGRLSQKLLVIVDEINEGGSNGRWDNSETLKSMLTLEQREINPKYGYPIVEWNAARWLMFSNHLSALPLDDTDRRYEVVRHDAPPKPGSYYKQIWAAVKDPAFIAGVAQYLAQRDISQFNPGGHAHMSEAKRDLVQASRTETDDMVTEIIDSHPADVIANSTLGAKLNNHAFAGALTPHQRHALDRAGAVPYGKKVWLAGKTVNVRILRNHELWKEATPQQILAEMSKGSATGFVAGLESRLQ